MKKLKELAKQTKWKEVKKTLLFYYPDQKKSIEEYKKVFEKVQQMPDLKTKKGEYIDIIRLTDSFEKEMEYYNVAIRQDKITDRYAMDFTPWKIIANLPVKRNNLLTASIVSQCLWEMTFHGFHEKEIQTTIKNLMSCLPKS